ncbi:MAG: hypothetical protein BWY91_00365 [bacterium ADurb.BinA028]|nr:MAG: hypothetical protein BWY91_00365 [bacterium ADurb.BinA028]
MDLTPYGPPGRRIVEEVLAQLAEDDLEPDARDRALLDTAARLADRMAQLRDLVAEDGERSVSESGIVRLHPGIAEHRNHAVSLAKVLAGISLRNDSAKNPAKVHAAETRWRAHNAAKAVG